jgi:hypothetical protein
LPRQQILKYRLLGAGLGKSRQVEASRRLVRALVDGRFARSARRQWELG